MHSHKEVTWLTIRDFRAHFSNRGFSHEAISDLMPNYPSRRDRASGKWVLGLEEMKSFCIHNIQFISEDLYSEMLGLTPQPADPVAALPMTDTTVQNTDQPIATGTNQAAQPMTGTIAQPMTRRRRRQFRTRTLRPMSPILE